MPANLPAALANFDALPAAARVRLPAVAQLFAVSESTIIRRAKAGALPAPRKDGHVLSWAVGDLRKALEVAA
ncbi:MAG: transcriptional regulator [Candidatus Accumulibacter sp. UW25]